MEIAILLPYLDAGFVVLGFRFWVLGQTLGSTCMGYLGFSVRFGSVVGFE